MKTSARKVDAAWSLFWADPAQSRCAAGAPEIWQSLADHWSSFATSLQPGTRVLDLGCGAGAVGRMLLDARDDLHITGVDAAKVPRSNHARLELLSDTDMESLPFPELSFGAVVSQFGYEYSNTADAAREIARVLAPGAKLSFLVHHSESAIVRTNRAHLGAVVAFLDPDTRAAFCSGDVVAFNSRLSLLVEKHPDDELIRELARALPGRLGWLMEKRVATWEALEEALAPERSVSDSLNDACVAPAQIDEWLDPLRQVGALDPVSVLRETNGDPIAWRTVGARGAQGLAVTSAS
jgi:SAM-dependent methyltransferase